LPQWINLHEEVRTNQFLLLWSDENKTFFNALSFFPSQHLYELTTLSFVLEVFQIVQYFQWSHKQKYVLLTNVSYDCNFMLFIHCWTLFLSAFNRLLVSMHQTTMPKNVYALKGKYHLFNSFICCDFPLLFLTNVIQNS